MAKVAVGVDIGGTKIALGIVDSEGSVLAKTRFATGLQNSPETLTLQIAATVKQLIQSQNLPVPCVGIGMAGQIEPRSGFVHFAPNLKWENFPFGKILSEKLGLPVYVTNDVKVATIGEWVFGAGKGIKDLVCLFVGTGVGGGIVLNDQIVNGADNSAGELGHIVIDWNGPSCHCGNHGCLEAFAGGWAIGRAARERVSVSSVQGKCLLDLSNGELKNINAKVVTEALNQQDPLAIQIFEQVEKALIAGAVSIVNGLNPSCLILGGGVIAGNPWLIQKIEIGIREKALSTASNRLQVVGATLGNDAGIVGAAQYARQQG